MTLPEWIKCTDRFPKHGEYVSYTWHGDHARNDVWYCQKKQTFMERWDGAYAEDRVCSDAVTYWKPEFDIPAPDDEV